MIILHAGRYAGKTLEEIWEIDSKYLIFLVENVKSKNYPIEEIKAFLAPRLEQYQAKEAAVREVRKSLYKPICDSIKGVMIKRGLNNKGINFFANMLKSLEEGRIISHNASSILCDSLAKSKGRRNSNIYKENLNRYSSIMEEVINLNLQG